MNYLFIFLFQRSFTLLICDNDCSLYLFISVWLLVLSYIYLFMIKISLYIIIPVAICILYKVDLVIYNYTATKLDFISKLQQNCPDIEKGFLKQNIVLLICFFYNAVCLLYSRMKESWFSVFRERNSVLGNVHTRVFSFIFTFRNTLEHFN